MGKNYILTIDEGTTSTRALLMDRHMNVVGMASKELSLIYPNPAEVEQNPEEIYQSTVDVIRQCVKSANVDPNDIEAVGLTVQRGTFCLFNRKTGKPLTNFFVWMDRRGQFGRERFFNDPDFCKNHPDVVEWMKVFANDPLSTLEYYFMCNPDKLSQMDDPDIALARVDTWLIYKFTKNHYVSNSVIGSGRLDFYDYGTDSLRLDLLPYTAVKQHMLPEIKSEIDDYGMLDSSILGVEIPIRACIADQQSALFAQGCHVPGSAKCTLGTGAFLDVNVGDKLMMAPGLSHKVAWCVDGKRTYLLEGISNAAGSSLKWGRDMLKLYSNYEEMNALAASVPDNGGVYFVPALGGMETAPFMNPTGRGSFMGLSSTATNAHLCRALSESVSFVIANMFKLIADLGAINRIGLDGGVSRSNFICQMIADITGAVVIRPVQTEATALGAAELAAISSGWFTMEEAKSILTSFGNDTFEPNPDNYEKLQKEFHMWLKAVERSKNWIEV